MSSRFSRRDFLRSVPLLGLSAPALIRPPGETARPSGRSPIGERPGVGPSGGPDVSTVPPPDSLDPWVELVEPALRHNARLVHEYTGGRPILMVVKNDAYGLGARAVARLMEPAPEIAGFAVIRAAEAVALREAGIEKPVVMLEHNTPEEAAELVSRNVRLSPFHDSAPRQLTRLAERFGRRVPVHLYVDTGMNRVGMPHERALQWMWEIARTGAARVEGTLTMFAGDGTGEFARVQLDRFRTLAREAGRAGLDLGTLHAAPSRVLINYPDAHLDMVRPGNAIYGREVFRYRGEEEVLDLRPTFRLRARVARVSRLEAGESAGFDRAFVAERPTWVATVPVGHTDGYPKKRPEGGRRALIGERLYPVIAEVTSNHTLVEIGPKKTVEVGDAVTLVGSDREEIRPHAVAEASGIEDEYWIMTGLKPSLPRVVASD